jgi:hypothetical protein
MLVGRETGMKGKKGFQPGEFNPSATPEGRERISKWKKANPTPAEVYKKIGKALKKRLEKDKELKEKWRAAKRGHVKAPSTKKKISIGVRKTKAKKGPPKTAVKMADRAFSNYIRLKYADENGMIECFTCGERRSIKEMDCGHYVSRQHKSLRWDERNAHPQCWACNRFNEGRKDEYALRLIKKYGPDILNQLQVEKHQALYKADINFRELTDKYSKMAKALLEEKIGQKVYDDHPLVARVEDPEFGETVSPLAILKELAGQNA